MRIATVVLLTTCTALVSCTRTPHPQQPAPFVPEAIATTRQIMLGITAPTSDVVFQVSVEAPKDDIGWEKVQANAISLAESANLLMIPPRAVDQQDWIKYCKQLVQTAKGAAQAAQARNADQVMAAGDQVYEVCDACHKQYMAARGGV